MSAFHSRAYLLLQKELFKVNQLKLWGIFVEFVDDDLFCWKVTLSGLKDTPWQDGKFIVIMQFSENYNFEPPHVFFKTIPLHPNIHCGTGELCLGGLEQWNSEFSIAFILLSIQNILSEPMLPNAINDAAANLVCQSPVRYNQIVLDCVLQSNRTESAISNVFSPADVENVPKVEEKKESTKSSSVDEHPNKPRKKPRHLKLSYESYLKSWRATATTQTSEGSQNPLLNMIGDDIDEIDYCEMKGKIDEEVYHQLSEHRLLMYGQFQEADRERRKMETLKANKIQLLKDIKSNKNFVKNLQVSVPTSPDDELDDDIDTAEVQNILAWTENLPTD